MLIPEDIPIWPLYATPYSAFLVELIVSFAAYAPKHSPNDFHVSEENFGDYWKISSYLLASYLQAHFDNRPELLCEELLIEACTATILKLAESEGKSQCAQAVQAILSIITNRLRVDHQTKALDLEENCTEEFDEEESEEEEEKIEEQEKPDEEMPNSENTQNWSLSATPYFTSSVERVVSFSDHALGPIPKNPYALKENTSYQEEPSSPDVYQGDCYSHNLPGPLIIFDYSKKPIHSAPFGPKDVKSVSIIITTEHEDGLIELDEEIVFPILDRSYVCFDNLQPGSCFAMDLEGNVIKRVNRSMDFPLQ